MRPDFFPPREERDIFRLSLSLSLSLVKFRVDFLEKKCILHLLFLGTWIASFLASDGKI